MTNAEGIHIGDSGWRAIYTEGFTLDRLESIVASLVSLYPKRCVLIGYDNRFLSEEFAHHIAFLAVENGWDVEILSQAFPTPGIGTLVRRRTFDFGLVVTASHNPYYYNGLKILDCHGALIDRALANAIERGANDLLRTRASTHLQIGKRFSRMVNFKEAQMEYLEMVCGHVNTDAIRSAGLKVAWDAFGGTVTRLLPKFLEFLNIKQESVPMIEEPTYQKRRLEPDAASLKELGTLVLKTKASIGVATDIDGDRFSAVDEQGRYIQNNPLGSLLVWYLLKVRGELGTVYQTVSCSSLTEKICAAFHAPLKTVPIGFQKMGRMMVEDPKPLIGIEETGGLAYGSHLPFKDGFMAQVLLLEMLATQKETITEMIAQLRSEYGTFHYNRVDLRLSSESDIEQWLDGASWEKRLNESIVSILTIDGIKWTFASGGWILIRRSKTEPLLRIYFESEDPKFLEKISRCINEEYP